MRKMVSIFVLLALCIATNSIWAQARPVESPQSDKKIIRIKKFLGTGRVSKLKTPVYNTTQRAPAINEKEWHSLFVQFDTAKPWIDEISVSYYALALGRDEKGNKKFSFYKKIIRYIDVPKGRRHQISAYIAPHTIERYGDIVAAAVVFSVNGKEQDVAVSKTMGSVPDDFWKNSKVVDSPNVISRDGYILSKKESPFSLVNYDDYETER